MLSNDYLHGGLKNDQNKYLNNNILQIKWILRLLEHSNENWKIIPLKYIENVGANFLTFT